MFLSLFLLAGGILSAQQTADIPRILSYQGLLASHDGNPLPDGEYPITITLYGDERGGNGLWQDTYIVPVRGGVFNIYLGSGKNPLPAPSQMDRPFWIGTRVGEAEEMRPLTQLSASPYAINVADNAITTNKLAAGAVTADKVTMEYLAGVTLNGEKIMGNGRILNIQAGKDINIHYDDVTGSLVIGAASEERAGNEKDGDRALQGTAQDAWTMRGNGITVPGGGAVGPAIGDYIGTNNNVDFNLHVDNTRIMSYQRKAPGATPSIVGGYHLNDVSNVASIGNTIAGGGGVGGPNIIDGNWYNTISGGFRSRIMHMNSSYGTVSGGDANEVGTAANAVAYGTIAGGQGNQVTANYGAISGGGTNRILHPSSIYGALGGGLNNEIATPTTPAAYGTIAGGQGNRVAANYGMVAGGLNNVVQGTAGALAGGEGNRILHASSIYGALGGGRSNEIGTTTTSAAYGTVAGGQNNRVTANYGMIGGGTSNSVQGVAGAITGGEGNSVSTFWGSVGGGRSNAVNSSYGTIAGGLSNSVQSTASTIGGGEANYIKSDNSTISGGVGNFIDQSYGAIGGGAGNQIVGSGIAAAIPGGESLIAQSYGQTVLGVLNIPKGNMAPGGSPNDEPILIIGNGIQGRHSNAFEVSYNGHSTVFHNTQGKTPVITGSTYTDNVIYAWGSVDRNGTSICDFGVKTIFPLGGGVYRVVLSVVDPDGNHITLDKCSSVTAMIHNEQPPAGGWNGICGFISTSMISNNEFEVYTADQHCNRTDLPFMFKVTSRP